MGMHACVYVQGTGGRCGGETKQEAVWKAEAMLLQRSVESVLFQGRKLAGETNADKVERFARELAKEHARRKQQQQLSLGGHPRPGDVPPVVVDSAAAPNSNDKEQPTPKATASATASTVAPAEQAAAANGGTGQEARPRDVAAGRRQPAGARRHAVDTRRCMRPASLY
jgi:hypothetical protein